MTILRSFGPAAAVLILASLHAGVALCEEVIINFTGTVSVPSGNLNGPILAGHTVAGTLTYESTTAGVYTPSPNPMFARAEMLYTGAMVSANFTHQGVNGVSGTGGDVFIYDSLDAMFGGDDSWEGTATMTTGSIGGVAIASIWVNPNTGATAWTLSPGDDVPTPVDESESAFNQFQINSVGGGSAYGSIDSYEVIGGGGGEPVPLLNAVGVLGLIGALGGFGGLAVKRSRGCVGRY